MNYCIIKHILIVYTGKFKRIIVMNSLNVVMPERNFLFMGKKAKLILCVILSIVILCGCTSGNRPNGTSGTPDNSGTPGLNSTGKTFSIVTSFYPMYLFARSIANNIDNVTVTNMAPPQTGCLHDYTIRPGDMKLLEKADVFIINGAGIENFIQEVAHQLPLLKVVEASKGIQLLKNNANAETEFNPHIWVSPSGAIKQVNNIADSLVTLDPGNADLYKRNSADLIIRLTDLKNRMDSELKSIQNRNIVTFHEAFNYFAQDFNLNVVALIESEPDRQPSPKEIIATIKTIRDTGTKALFTEPQYSANTANTISQETGAKIYVLDPIVTGTDSPPLDDYFTKMNKNLEQLKEALK